MLGQFHPTSRKVQIVGGGIAGLLAAYALSKKGYDIELFEASKRFGGLIQTLDKPLGMVELAAHSIPSTSQVLKLFNDIGVEYVFTNDGVKGGRIWRDGRMRKMPLNFLEVLGMLVRALTKRSDGEQKSLAQFAGHHLGQAAHDYLIAPMTTGIYAATPEYLDVPPIFPQLAVPQGKTLMGHMLFGKKQKREKRGKLIAPKNGMQALVDGLVEYLEKQSNVQLYLNKAIKELPDGDNVVITVPAHKLDGLYPDLPQVTYSPLITATVLLPERVKTPNAFGLLLPPKLKANILGVLFNSKTFKNRVKQKNAASLTVMLAGTERPDFLDKTDAELEMIIKDDLEHYLRLNAQGADITITRWKEAIPLYNANLMDLWQQFVTKAKPGHILFGNYTGQVSIRGMIQTVMEW